MSLAHLDSLVVGMPDGFLLRGSLLTRQWVDLHRLPRDLDVLATFPYDLDEVVRRWEPVAGELRATASGSTPNSPASG